MRLAMLLVILAPIRLCGGTQRVPCCGDTGTMEQDWFAEILSTLR